MGSGSGGVKRFEVQCEVWEVGRADRSGRVFVEAVERGKWLGAVFGVRFGEKFTSSLPEPVPVCDEKLSDGL